MQIARQATQWPRQADLSAISPEEAAEHRRYHVNDFRGPQPPEGHPVVVHPDGQLQSLAEWVHEARGGPKAQQTCKFCADQATASVIHSEGMAYIPACDKHLGKAKDAAAECVPYGGADPSNIDRVDKIGSQWDDLYHNVQDSGGYTMREHPGDAPSKGYMVSVPGAEEVQPMDTLGPGSIEDYNKRHHEQIQTTPDLYAGGWADDGEFYHDLSKHHDDIWDAAREGYDDDQIAFYDLKNDIAPYSHEFFYPGQNGEPPTPGYYMASEHTAISDQGRFQDDLANDLQTGEPLDVQQWRYFNYLNRWQDIRDNPSGGYNPDDRVGVGEQWDPAHVPQNAPSLVHSGYLMNAEEL